MYNKSHDMLSAILMISLTGSGGRRLYSPPQMTEQVREHERKKKRREMAKASKRRNR